MNNTQKLIGAANQNLVLVTAGRLYVKVADRYYELDFRNEKVKEAKQEIVEPQEIDLSIYITNEQLEEILEDYDFNEAIETLETEIANLKILMNDLQDKVNDLEYGSDDEDRSSSNTEIWDLDQTSFEYIRGLYDGTIVDSGIHYDYDNECLVCPATFIKHFYVLQRENHILSYDITSFARWTVSEWRVDESLDVENNDNTYSYFDSNPRCYLYIVANSNLSNDNTSNAYYYVTDEKKDLLENGYYYFLAGIISFNEFGEVQFTKTNTNGVPSFSKIESNNKTININLEDGTFSLCDKLVFSECNLELSDYVTLEQLEEKLKNLNTGGGNTGGNEEGGDDEGEGDNGEENNNSSEDLTEIKKSIKEIKDKLTWVEETLLEIIERLIRLEDRVTVLENKVASLEEKSTEYENRISKLETDLVEQKNELETKIQALSDKIDRYHGTATAEPTE